MAQQQKGGGGGPKDMDTVSTLLANLNNLSDKFIKLQEDKEKMAITFAEEFDAIRNGVNVAKKLSFANIIRGLISTSSGSSPEYLGTLILFTIQQDYEKNRDLTNDLLGDLRSAFAIRLDEDKKIWDKAMISMFDMLLRVVSNFALTIRGEEHKSMKKPDEEDKDEGAQPGKKQPRQKSQPAPPKRNFAAELGF